MLFVTGSVHNLYGQNFLGSAKDLRGSNLGISQFPIYILQMMFCWLHQTQIVSVH